MLNKSRKWSLFLQTCCILARIFIDRRKKKEEKKNKLKREIQPIHNNTFLPLNRITNNILISKNQKKREQEYNRCFLTLPVWPSIVFEGKKEKVLQAHRQWSGIISVNRKYIYIHLSTAVPGDKTRQMGHFSSGSCSLPLDQTHSHWYYLLGNNATSY